MKKAPALAGAGAFSQLASLRPQPLGNSSRYWATVWIPR
jgi:hypothetical protein